MGWVGGILGWGQGRDTPPAPGQWAQVGKGVLLQGWAHPARVCPWFLFFFGGKWHLEDKESCSCPKPPRSLAVVVAAAAEAVRNSLMALLLRS